MKSWSSEDVEFLRQNYPIKGAEFCAEVLHRTKSAVYGKACSLKLSIENNPYSGYTHQDYEKKLFTLEINHYPLEPYLGYDTPIKHECINGHITNRSPNSVLAGSNCSICANNYKKDDYSYTNTLIRQNIEYVPLEPYINTDTKIIHKCVRGHTWSVAPKHILSGRKCPQCSGVTGYYCKSFFTNNPEVGAQPGILYCVVLVCKKTNERLCVKIGITRGTSNKDVLSRCAHFKGYEARIQKTVFGTLEEIYYLEDYLHELWSDHRYTSEWKFGGSTELFSIDKLSEILTSIPKTT